jgi:hypothetical protein
MMRSTFRPAMAPASLVAWRWASLKYAGDRDHGVGHLLAQVTSGIVGEPAQDLGRDLLGSVELASHVESYRLARARDDREREVLDLGLHFGIAAADEAFGRVDRVLGVEHGLALCHLAHEPFAALGESHHRGRQTVALAVDDHRGLAALHDRRHRVRGAQIDADCLGHGLPPTR